MQNLFLELTILVSLAIIVYLMSAALPRVEDKKEEEDSVGVSKRSSLPLDKLDEVLLRFKDKFLRKMKVFVMKVDNFISKQLKSKKNP